MSVKNFHAHHEAAAAGAGADDSDDGGAAEPSADVNQYESELVELYTKHAPEKVGKVRSLLVKYEGMEEKLLKAVREKCVLSSLP